MDTSGGIFGWIKTHPTLILLMAVVAIFGIFFLKPKSATTTTTTPAANLSGLSTDANGSPIVYRDVADTFINTTTTDSYNTTNPAHPVEHPIEPQTLLPAPKGTLGKYGAGKNDTNFWVYTTPAGATLTSLAETAKWGTDATKLENYRNNLQILQAAGVDINNPYATVPTGLELSI